MSRVTFREWHVERNMSRVTCREWHVKSDMSRVTCLEWHVEIDMSRVICQEWQVESDMASGSRLATFWVFQVKLLCCQNISWSIQILIKTSYWEPPISVSLCLRVIHWDLVYQKILCPYCISHNCFFRSESSSSVTVTCQEKTPKSFNLHYLAYFLFLLLYIV